jgi:hypothetical protein
MLLFTEDMVGRLPHTEYWPKEPMPDYYELLIDCEGRDRCQQGSNQEALIDAIGENCENVAVFIFDSMASALIFQAFYLNKLSWPDKAWLCADPCSAERYLVYLTRDRKDASWWAGVLLHKD